MDNTERMHLEEAIATRLLEGVDQKTLETIYWDMQKEWAETLTDEELLETAKDLNIGDHLLETN